jgi:hypothetical protein
MRRERSSRWFQFSLRTLFVVVTAVAMLIGVVRITGDVSTGVAFTGGAAILVFGFWTLAIEEGKGNKIGIIWGCLLSTLGVITIFYSLLPRVY